MAEFPFPLTIRPASSNSQPQTIMCVGLLRRLDKKRKVFDAMWGQKPVVAKLFTAPIKAKYHMKREWRGLKLLQERGLNSPTPLFYGKTKQHDWAVVTEKIDKALTVREVWDKIADRDKKRELLCRIGRELAKQHSKGVLQKDLHLGNFLLQKEKLFALDPAQMRFVAGEVDKKQAISQLALLTSIVPDEDTDTVVSVCEEYARVRSWKFTQSDMVMFWKKLAGHKKTGIKKALKKCLRTNKRHQRIKEGSFRGVTARDFFEKADFRKFVENVDELTQKGQILKNGNTCFVSRINFVGKDVVVKRYNHKGIIHSIRHTIKRSRAHRCWLHAHRLEMLNIATPRPLAYIEQCKGGLVWKSYLVTEYIEGQKLYDFLRNSGATKQQRSKVTGQVKELLDKIGKHRITHGDLKHTNILITDNGPVLTDLDGMKVHKWNCTCRVRQAKDLKSFVNRID